jgi:hypothetical protein
MREGNRPIIRSFEPGENLAWCYPTASSSLPRPAAEVEAGGDLDRRIPRSRCLANGFTDGPSADGHDERKMNRRQLRSNDATATIDAVPS